MKRDIVVELDNIDFMDIVTAGFAAKGFLPDSIVSEVTTAEREDDDDLGWRIVMEPARAAGDAARGEEKDDA